MDGRLEIYLFSPVAVVISIHLKFSLNMYYYRAVLKKNKNEIKW